MSTRVTETTTLPQTGRPREFNVDQALRRAMFLFWRRGYEGVSISDLTDALHIARPSLYAAFGNKEQLFRKVLDRYGAETGFLEESLLARTAREAVEGMLRGAANFHARRTNPPGCLMVHGALVGSVASWPSQKETRLRRAQLTEAIEERLKRGQDEGDVSASSDTRAVARYVATVLRGMAVESQQAQRAKSFIGLWTSRCPRGQTERAERLTPHSAARHTRSLRPDSERTFVARDRMARIDVGQTLRIATMDATGRESCGMKLARGGPRPSVWKT